MHKFITIKTNCNHTLYVNLDHIAYVVDREGPSSGKSAPTTVCLTTGDKYEISDDEYERLRQALTQAH